MKRIWFHGASAGDIRALHPLLERIRQSADLEVAALTTWTRSGASVAERLFPDLERSRPPIPVAPLTNTFLDRVAPDLLVLEYLEWYPSWLSACKQRGIPVVFVDGRVSHRSLRIKTWLRRTAHCIESFGARSSQDAENAVLLGVPESRVFVTGNGKFDGFSGGPPAPSADLVEAVGQRDVVIGSVHPDEERDLIEALSEVSLRVLIAPRYLRRVPTLERRLREAGLSVGRRTQGRQNTDVVLLDSMGELAEAYGLAPVAIIGGTFGRRGGQNLFEAALHNRLILHGPSTANIQAEVECLRDRGAYLLDSWRSALKAATDPLSLPAPDTLRAVHSLRGATQRNLELVLEALRSRTAIRDT